MFIDSSEEEKTPCNEVNLTKLTEARTVEPVSGVESEEKLGLAAEVEVMEQSKEEEVKKEEVKDFEEEQPPKEVNEVLEQPLPEPPSKGNCGIFV